MSFDKTKAMRNAERFLSQGKISSAIGEFRQVITHDPRDFSTMNMLGDLYVKNSETKPAADCYKAVAEHYAKQGFAQKSIAVYNKIVKLNPNSPETTLRLAELYREKGSIGDARVHFQKVAEQMQREGRQVEALEIWRQVADLDPNNTASLITVAEGYATEGFNTEAAEAYSEAGRRFENLGETEQAYQVYSKALEHEPESAEILQRLVETGHSTGHVAEANAKVIEAHDTAPNNADIHSLLVDCHAKVSDLEAAERTLVKLIEQDPTCFPKLLELSTRYLDSNDAASAVRMLSIASEHMLMQGKAEELCGYVASVLAMEPEQVDALRIMVRCASWLKDEAGMRASLTSMAKCARAEERLDDERYALSQLVLLLPHDREISARLSEVNKELGVEDEPVAESIFDSRFAPRANGTNGNGTVMLESSTGTEVAGDFAIVGVQDLEEPGADDPPAELDDAAVMPDLADDISVLDDDVVTTAEQEIEPEIDDDPMQKELDSIRFYIESGYIEIAEKAIEEFYEKFGENDEIAILKANMADLAIVEETVETAPVESIEDSPVVEETGEETLPEPIEKLAAPASPSGAMELADLRNELGLDEFADDAGVGNDYETHYQTAVAYQEMYLLEDAIKEFQAGVALVHPNDGTRRFFQCANLLGHCFMQLGKPNLAVRWFKKTLESAGLTDDEKLGIWYELAVAYEGDGDHANASKYYEQVYAENINFRDVANRVNSLVASG